MERAQSAGLPSLQRARTAAAGLGARAGALGGGAAALKRRASAVGANMMTPARAEAIKAKFGKWLAYRRNIVLLFTNVLYVAVTLAILILGLIILDEHAADFKRNSFEQFVGVEEPRPCGAHARRHEAAREPGRRGRRRLGERLARARLPELDDQDRPRHLLQDRARDRRGRLVGAVHHRGERARAGRALPARHLLLAGRQHPAAHRGGGAVGRPLRQGGALRDARVPAGQGRGRARALLRGAAARLVRRLPRARRPRVHRGDAGVHALPRGEGGLRDGRRHQLAL